MPLITTTTTPFPLPLIPTSITTTTTTPLIAPPLRPWLSSSLYQRDGSQIDREGSRMAGRAEAEEQAGGAGMSCGGGW